jgi:glycosyltransferase involved in cell wall biosynthesis
MHDTQPRVSIGMPVYNGENYIQQALDAILVQTYPDFEVIISDNASTDRTQEICRTYAAKDKRIRYYRQDRNCGPAWNFNLVFELSRGEYFKWAAHDDLLAPDFLEKCVEVLDRDPNVVLCNAKANVIDECDGRYRGKYDINLNTESPEAHKRFYGLIYGDPKLGEHRCYEVFGLIRADSLRKTPLIGKYAHADGVLLVYLAFLGRFHEIPEYLFFPRVHAKQSMEIARTNYHLYTGWFDPKKEGKVSLPRWRILREYFFTIWQAPISKYQKTICYLHLMNWVRHKRHRLKQDVIIAAQFTWGRFSEKFQPQTSALKET